MGKFKAEGTIVRRLDRITIIFWSKESIYVYENGADAGVIFNRWFTQRRSYEYWRDFRRKMLRYKNLSVVQCCEIAATYDISVVSTRRKLSLSGRKIIYRE